MNEIGIVVLFVLGITGFFYYLDYVSRVKLRKQIKSDWGNIPRGTKRDTEKSLYKAFSLKNQQENSLIDDLTWQDLDMFEVFQRLNLTYSSIGSEKLYETLRSYSLSDDKTSSEEIIAYFKEHPAEREAFSYQFAQLGKKDFNYIQAYLNEQTKPVFEQQGLFAFLGLLPIISLLSAIFIGPVGLFVGLASLCFNTIFYFIQKGKLDVELGTMSYLVQSLSLGTKLSKKNSPVKEDLQKKIAPFQKVLPFAFAFKTKTGGEMEMMVEMLGGAFLLPFISYGTVSKALSHHQQDAKDIWDLLGQLEVSIAILNLREVYGDHWCLPEFTDKNEVVGENVIHPLLSEPVPNPVAWQKSTLITGSNASGKSTYVRSVAINCLLAQTLNTCLATSFQLKRGHILSSMGVSDSVIDGDSYFIAEIKSLRRLINQVATGEFCYTFIDEILKGTNTIERIAASSSVIQWLNQQHQLTFVATHDIELPQILGGACDNIHFEETVEKDQGITFDYLLKDGVATSRNAIKLIDALGFPDEIVAHAFESATYFDTNKAWHS
ncbi:MutS-related protein [Vagococcus hydrophili]|uniref:DNA mismatch repair protein MutS n=1 Tax=Vagococcus hydrophili TaxID=2714947 RepID=A0A6G8ASY4_9ENTE|nr:DNA mismatch repair protein MutS [Vagococcus hydrophili]QIL48188.1 DNA mismatch repair protein MutS [Vagococcus hydrophili]